MKQILEHKMKISYKNFIRYFLIGLGHYAMMFIYALLLLGVRYGMYGHFLDINDVFYQSIILYSIIFAPAINTLLHVWFAELGKPWIRFLMWNHTLVCFVLIGCGVLL